MSEQDFTVLGINAHTQPTEETLTPSEFAEGITRIIQSYEEDDADEMPPFTHLLASIMMEVFAPGFIIIGSPNTIPSLDGIDLPADVGVMINGKTNLTATTVGHFLGLLSSLIEDSAETGILDLTGIYGESGNE